MLNEQEHITREILLDSTTQRTEHPNNNSNSNISN
jgi:hypothetical protein